MSGPALERIEELGKGGMGVVYRVKDHRLGREAALKLIRGKADGDAIRRFRREAEITARLDHPSIPPVFESGITPSGQHYILMRVVNGSTLSGRIGVFHADHAELGTGERELRELLEVLVKVGEAVAYAHDQGVIHRDLKPDNVMVGRFGEVLVMDWGLARERGRRDEGIDLLLSRSTPQLSGEEAERAGLTQVGAIVGTPGYMPPEQVEGSAVDELADVFALGAILSCVLTGRPPIEGATPINKIMATLKGRVVLPCDRRMDVPGELSSITEKALEVERRERYGSAEAFVSDLKAYLAGRDVSEHSYGPWERAQRFPRQRPQLVAVTLVVLLLAVIGALALGLTGAEGDRRKAEASERAAQASERLMQEEKTKAEASDLVAQGQRVRAEASEQASRVFSDEGKVRLLLEEGDVLLARVEDIERWLRRAVDLLDGRKEHMARLKTIRKPPPGESDEQRVVREVELTALKSLREGFDALAPRPDLERARLSFARSVVERTISGPEAKAIWAEAATSISSLEVYGGFSLRPVVGLVPLGRDPESGLWEFWHVESGEQPQRNAQGRHILCEESGVVLVLIPGGTFRMGSERGQPDERPIHQVRLAPYFLSKHELTQGQWLRATGENPSQYQGGEDFTLRHPVEQVSWNDCRAVAFRLGLRLPSEAEYEYACRAGTNTLWWSGDEPGSLHGAASVADQSLERSVRGRFKTETWDDGNPVHAPVGSFRPNLFGLHDTAGNVLEWIQDVYRPSYEGAPRDGTSVAEGGDSAGASNRVLRGGSWSDDAVSCRSASRNNHSPASRGGYLGVRVARSLR